MTGQKFFSLFFSYFLYCVVAIAQSWFTKFSLSAHSIVSFQTVSNSFFFACSVIIITGYVVRIDGIWTFFPFRTNIAIVFIVALQYGFALFVPVSFHFHRVKRKSKKKTKSFLLVLLSAKTLYVLCVHSYDIRSLFLFSVSRLFFSPIAKTDK